MFYLVLFLKVIFNRSSLFTYFCHQQIRFWKPKQNEKKGGLLLLSCRALWRWTFLEQRIETDFLESSWRLAGAAALKRGMETLKTESLFQTAVFSKFKRTIIKRNVCLIMTSKKPEIYICANIFFLFNIIQTNDLFKKLIP